MTKKKKFSRRTFLKATGWTAAGITVAYFGGRALIPPLPTMLALPNDSTSATWLQLGSDGRFSMFSPRSEMGQNAITGLMQIVAEELNIDVDDIVLKYPTTTADIPPVMLTAGSMSTSFYSRPTARMAAVMREALRDQAATRSQVDSASVQDSSGGFALPDGSVISYAEIGAGEAVLLDADDFSDVPLYTFDTSRKHKQVGKPAKPRQIHEIVNGEAVYACDVRLPDMLYGRAVQPPAQAAKLVSVDDAKARTIPGLVQIVVDRDKHFVGVVCETPGTVNAAIDALKVEWELPFPFNQKAIDQLTDVDAALTKGELEHVLVDGVIDEDKQWDVDLLFALQVQNHAIMEPRSAVTRIGEKDGKTLVEMWTGSQDPYYMQRHIAEEMGIDPEQVVIHSMRMGGGFGGREYPEVQTDCVRLARAAGRPVKVQWSRADEFVGARHRPASKHRVRLSANDAGGLEQWHHAFVSGHVMFSRDRFPKPLSTVVKTLTGDMGATRGAKPPYAATVTRIEMDDVDLPIDLGSWRSLGAAPNTFPIECAIDELARVRGIDPVEFRLKNIPEEHHRLAVCLRKVRELANKVILPRTANVGRGYACGIYAESSFVAVSADVQVNEITGAIQVLRMCCAQDVGMVINPDQVKAQIEGNLIWGLGSALFEQVELGEGSITSLNFGDYPIPRVQDAPEFDIEIISDPSIAPSGVGEVAIIPAAPAIVNALRDATGKRFTRLPIRNANSAA